MSTNHHTPIPIGAAANALVLRSPMGELDDAITTLDGDLSTLDGDLSTLSGAVTTLDGDLSTLSDAVTALDADFYRRNVDHWVTPTQHFDDGVPDPLTNVAGSPFVAGNQDYSLSSIYRIYGSSANDRVFHYQSVSVTTAQNMSLSARLYAGLGVSIVGLRSDAGNDNDYMELGFVTSGTTLGKCNLIYNLRVGGGAVSPVVLVSDLPAPKWYDIRLYMLGAFHFLYYNVDSPLWGLLALPARGYTATRVGIVCKQDSGGVVNNETAGFFDWYRSA